MGSEIASCILSHVIFPTFLWSMHSYSHSTEGETEAGVLNKLFKSIQIISDRTKTPTILLSSSVSIRLLSNYPSQANGDKRQARVRSMLM